MTEEKEKLPRPQQGKQAVVVLGMHRSGTSSLAGTFARLGAQMPQTLMESHATNPQGFYESIAVMQLNDDILASGGSHWDDWRAFDPDWYGSEIANQFAIRAARVMQEEFGDSSLIVLKDPRMCRLLPFWNTVLADAGYAPRYVLPLRSPMDVALSLKKRDNFSTGKSLLLWLRHMLDAERLSRPFARTFVNWAQFLKGWRLEIDRMSDALGLTLPATSDTVTTEIDGFLSPSLRHHETPDDQLAGNPDISSWVTAGYAALKAIGAGNLHESERLDRIRAEFDKASVAFSRMFADFEADLLEARQHGQNFALQCGALAVELEDKDRQLAALSHQWREAMSESDAVAAELASARVEAAQQYNQVEALLSSVLEKHMAEVRGHEIEIAAMADQLSTLDIRQRDQSEAIAQKDAELQQLIVDREQLERGLAGAQGRLVVEQDDHRRHEEEWQAVEESLREQLKEALGRIQQLEQAIAALKSSLEDQHDEFLRTKAQLHNARDLYAQAENYCAVLQQRLESLESEKTSKIEGLEYTIRRLSDITETYRTAGRAQFISWAVKRGDRP